LVVASSAAQAFDYIGLPEGIYPIVEATLYLATAPKSNSAGAYFKAMKKIEDEGAGLRAAPPDGRQPRCRRNGTRQGLCLSA
jgi:replication-associated recombination protein RarA